MCAQSRNQLICQFRENGPKPIFFLKIHILVYAKMPNIAVLGLLEVVRARIKALLYDYFKNGRAKIHILTFISKKGRVQAQKCNFIKKLTVSYRYRPILLEFMPFLWISGSDLCQK